MELKDLLSTDSSLALLFQSHLYGIESHIYSASDCRCYCFNRTFMELKAWNVVVDDAVEQFQSHLYGIERKDRILLKWCSGSVSIAPLWNWKMVESPTLPCPTMFQSHLYGIESQLSREKGWKEERFNRTFMELKGCCASAHRRAWPFQSHLYGIES